VAGRTDRQTDISAVGRLIAHPLGGGLKRVMGVKASPGRDPC